MMQYCVHENGNCKFCGGRLPTPDAKRRCRSDHERPRPHEGVGAILHAIVERAGYRILPGCACRRAIAAMNRNGPLWCLERINDLADIMISEARRRKIKVLGIEPPEFLLRLRAERWIRRAVREYYSKRQSQSPE